MIIEIGYARNDVPIVCFLTSLQIQEVIDYWKRMYPEKYGIYYKDREKPKSIATPEKLKLIKKDRIDGMTLKEMSEKYDISMSTLYRYVK